MLSGCNLLLVAWGDLTTPDPVQSVDVLWAKSPDFCAAMIHKDGREVFLLEGNLDAPDYTPTVGWSNSKVTRSGVAYIAIKEAWRSSLYRVNADGSLSRECGFVIRRMWFNLAI